MSVSDAAASTQAERTDLAARPHLARYQDLTCAQVAGLLNALGEYACRNPGRPSEFFWGTAAEDAVFAKSHAVFFDRILRPDADSAPGHPGIADRAVFGPADAAQVDKHKYMSGFGGLTASRLVEILDVFDQLFSRAPAVPQWYGSMDGLVRSIHAHGALRAFRERPFTSDEFSESVRAVLRGEPSRVAPSPPS